MGCTVIVRRKQTGTMMPAYIPKDWIGMTLLNAQDKNATAEVRDVTSIVEAAYLKV
jgi:hypothetical protein